jgi:hypothetical protein
MSSRLIDALSAERLLRDLDASAGPTMRRLVSDAKDHLWLLERLPQADLAADAEFQRRLCRHAGMRGKLRMRRDDLFAVLAGLRASEGVVYADVLLKVSQLTGQVEKSVASEILALLDPEQPTIDREVRELLPRYGFSPLPESPLFDECVAYHAMLRELMHHVIGTPAYRRLESRIDAAIGAEAAQLSRLRKFNLQLSASYRTVALMPNLDAVRKAAPRRGDSQLVALQADSAKVATPARQGVRLHLCR